MKKLVMSGLILGLACPLFGGGEEAPEMAPKDNAATTAVVSTTTPETSEVAVPETAVTQQATIVTGVETPETAKTTVETASAPEETLSAQVSVDETVTEQPTKEVTTSSTKAPSAKISEEDININLDSQEGTFDIDDDMFDTSVEQL